MYEEIKEKMNKAIAALENDYAAIRAGRANPALLDKITVDYYGTHLRRCRRSVRFPFRRLVCL